jgi:hypothetical protein
VSERKSNSLNWILWWRIEQDELNKQVAQYESMQRIQSARGLSSFLLLLSACVTTAVIVFGGLPAQDFPEVLIFLVLGCFIYAGHRWATIAAMVFWSIEKFWMIASTWAPAGSSPFNPAARNPVEQSAIHLVWWCVYMHAFYLAFRVEDLRRSSESK